MCRAHMLISDAFDSIHQGRLFLALKRFGLIGHETNQNCDSLEAKKNHKNPQFPLIVCTAGIGDLVIGIQGAINLKHHWIFKKGRISLTVYFRF